jgi:hypothetical protein
MTAAFPRGAGAIFLYPLPMKKKRTVLVVLRNRWNRAQKPRFLELDCDPEGNILKERTLRRPPTKAVYDEVWENDEGKNEFAACHKFSRKYGHKLQRPKS